MSTDHVYPLPLGQRRIDGAAGGQVVPAARAVFLVGCLVVFIAYPIAAVLARSLAAKGGGVTLAHFQTFFQKTYFLRSLSNTLVLGVTVTLVVMAMGFNLFTQLAQESG